MDLLELCKKYYDGIDELDSNRQGVSDINLNRIKIKVKDLKWHKVSQPLISGPFTRTVNIDRSSSAAASSHAFGQVKTSRECENSIRVTLESGLIKGLNKMLKLPLEGTDQELTDEFGTTLKIDPSKTVSEMMNKMTLGVSLEQAIGPGGASVIVQYKKKTCTLKFKCTVVMRGKTTKGDGLEATIKAIIECLKEKPGSQDHLQHLSIADDKVEFTMSGEVEFRWECELNFEWT